MKCTDCLYYYKIEGDVIPACNWYPKAPGECAPCEEEDYAEEENYMEDDENE